MESHYPFWIFDKYSAMYDRIFASYKNEIASLSYLDMQNGVKILEKYYINRLINHELELFGLPKEKYYFSLEKIDKNSRYYFVCSRDSNERTNKIFNVSDDSNYDEFATLNIFLSIDKFYYSSDIFKKVKHENDNDIFYQLKSEKSEIKMISKSLRKEKENLLKIFYYYLPEIICQIKSLNFEISWDIDIDYNNKK